MSGPAHVWAPGACLAPPMRGTGRDADTDRGLAPEPQLLPAGQDDGHASPGLAMHPRCLP
jgi:hypothetical protein